MHIVCAEVQDIVGPDKFASMPVCVSMSLIGGAQGVDLSDDFKL